MDKIIEKFLIAQNRLVFQSSDLSLEAIANMVKGEAIDIKPKYQRRERWNKDKQSALIESFLLNIPVPPIYLAEDEYGKYSVIDGKQRITSIYNFILHKEKLINLEKFLEIEGLTFDELPSPLNNALKIRPYIRVITLLKQSDSLLKYEVFNRLNTGGDKLLAQEIRNAAFESELNDLMVELSENNFFRVQFNIDTEKNREKSKIYKEMLDVEYVLRFFTLRESWMSFSGNMRKEMDNYMENNYRNPNIVIDDLRSIFNKTMELCSEIWDDRAFKRPDGRNEIIQGIYDVQTVALSYFLNEETKIIERKEQIIKKFNHLYFKDENFQISMRQFTSNIKQVNYRIGTMKNLFAEILK
ncbi:MAG: hypothetical protein B7Y37_11565 [Sphingobacteriia bacterium 28-36-52]|nr:MAG: hypothetical protein B7Y37_11565 [Sphingobacteriia bacterium 28-36-52]